MTQLLARRKKPGLPNFTTSEWKEEFAKNPTMAASQMYLTQAAAHSIYNWYDEAYNAYLDEVARVDETQAKLAEIREKYAQCQAMVQGIEEVDPLTATEAVLKTAMETGVSASNQDLAPYGDYVLVAQSYGITLAEALQQDPRWVAGAAEALRKITPVRAECEPCTPQIREVEVVREVPVEVVREVPVAQKKSIIPYIVGAGAGLLMGAVLVK